MATYFFVIDDLFAHQVNHISRHLEQHAMKTPFIKTKAYQVSGGYTRYQMEIRYESSRELLVYGSWKDKKFLRKTDNWVTLNLITPQGSESRKVLLQLV